MWPIAHISEKEQLPHLALGELGQAWMVWGRAQLMLAEQIRACPGRILPGKPRLPYACSFGAEKMEKPH